VTFACNWVCDYCSEDTHNRGSIDFEIIKEKVTTIPNHSSVIISGGEPGLAKKEVMNWIFEQLTSKHCYISVNTNGMFFKRYADLCATVDGFLYHCSEHLQEDEIWIPEHVDINKIDFLLVITNSTMDRLDYYINKYPEIKFTIFRATSIIKQDGSFGAGLSRGNAFKIYAKYKDRIDSNSFMHLMSNCNETSKIQAQQMLLGDSE
jgi:organic radical activating enzyme